MAETDHDNDLTPPSPLAMQAIAESDPIKFGKLLRRWRGQTTQLVLANQIGVKPQAVSQWERGETTPELPNFKALARILGTKILQPDPDGTGDEEMTFPWEEYTKGVVRVVGYVGAGAEAHFYAVSQGDLDEVPAPAGSTAKTVAVELRGDSLGSVFHRWLVFYDDVRSPVTSDLYGKLCVVGLADDRVLIKCIKPARNGCFDLLSEKEPPIKNVAVEWAAKVKNMSPR